LSTLNRSDVVLVGGATVIIVFTILITAALQGPSSSFSQIITVGPVWSTDTWVCTSDANFVVDATLRGLGDTQIAISVSGSGTQSFYSLVPQQLETFSVGGPSDSLITITRTGTVTGFITLQTISDATASCASK